MSLKSKRVWDVNILPHRFLCPLWNFGRRTHRITIEIWEPCDTFDMSHSASSSQMVSSRCYLPCQGDQSEIMLNLLTGRNSRRESRDSDMTDLLTHRDRIILTISKPASSSELPSHHDTEASGVTPFTEQPRAPGRRILKRSKSELTFKTFSTNQESMDDGSVSTIGLHGTDETDDERRRQWKVDRVYNLYDSIYYDATVQDRIDLLCCEKRVTTVSFSGGKAAELKKVKRKKKLIGKPKKRCILFSSESESHSFFKVIQQIQKIKL